MFRNPTQDVQRVLVTIVSIAKSLFSEANARDVHKRQGKLKKVENQIYCEDGLSAARKHAL